MSSLEKIKNGFFEHIGLTAALVLTGLIGWILTEVAPIVLPAIQEKLPSKVMLAILMLSIFINLLLAIAVWLLTRKREILKLRYGIFWDIEKNPHCPVCKNPGLQYSEWGYQLGYRCNPCDRIFSLCDSSGKDITPEVALKGL